MNIINFKLKMSIRLVYNERQIDLLSKQKKYTIDIELSKIRFNEYKKLIPKQFNKYYTLLSKIMNEQINSKLKYLILYAMARQAKVPQAGIGTNLRTKNNTTWIALGIEDSHYALIYLFHEILHGYFLPFKGMNYEQYELNHLLIEYFTDYRLFNITSNIKNIFIDSNKLSLFKLLDKEYKDNRLSASPFKDKILNSYKDYLSYIEKSKRYKKRRL